MTNALLTPQEVQDLEHLCNDPFLELGMTLRPKHLECFKAKIATSYMTVVIMFRNHNDAKKWNLMHEERIRTGGHLGTIALTALVYMLGGGAARSIATASTTAILKDEVQAHIWYPKMSKDWTLTQKFHFQL